jgi:hypothetical protein
MKKHKIFAYAVAPAVLGFGLFGATVASAHGLFGGVNQLTSDQIATRQQTMFQDEATLLGVSIDVVKNGWAQGKTLMQIAQDNGITKEQLAQKMQAQRTAQMKAQLQTLVEKGIITQAQADQRLAAMQARLTAAKGKIKNQHGHGFGRGHLED